MTYALADVLQTAVFAALTSDVSLSTMVDGKIYDAPPQGNLPSLFVTLGAERVRARSDVSAGAAIHDFVVQVMSDQPGYLTAKQAAARISDLLENADLTLARGRLVRLQFRRAAARKRRDGREIELWFRAFVEDA